MSNSAERSFSLFPSPSSRRAADQTQGIALVDLLDYRSEANDFSSVPPAVGLQSNGANFSFDPALYEVKTDVELALHCLLAPDDLTFGLAYGKLTDALRSWERSGTASEARPVTVTPSKLPVIKQLFKQVFDRAHTLELEAEAEDEDFYENMPYLQGDERPEVLSMLAEQTTNEYLAGRISAWLFISERLNNLERFTGDLNDLRKRLNPELSLAAKIASVVDANSSAYELEGLSEGVTVFRSAKFSATRSYAT